jgi:tRNA dimethylallyltransferase
MPTPTDQHNRPTLVVLLGPTGVGKTELSLTLAERLGSPVINADSRQIYAGIPICTAAPTAEQQARVKHYFVGQLPLTESYSAARYEADVLALLHHLFTTRSTALLSGGSMLYIDAVCQGIDDIPSIDTDTRQMLAQRYQTEGLDNLRDELRLLDPNYYAIVDLHNPKRIIHALEICYQTGRTYTSFRTRTTVPRTFCTLKIGLQRPREELYHRINDRVDQMMQQGLLDEARSLFPHRTLNALNTVGFKELFQYFDGLCTLPQALDLIRSHTRLYARKQMTWFRRQPDIHWFHPDQKDEIMKIIAELT